jgi:hypothetical protein
MRRKERSAGKLHPRRGIGWRRFRQLNWAEAGVAAARFAAIGLVASLIFIQAGSAQSSDGKSGMHWFRKCTSPEAYGQIECANYVRALVDYDELRSTSLKQKRFICAENGVTIGQSLDVVLKYLRAKPKDQHLPFVLLAHRALVTAFPCGNSGKASAKQR